MIFGVHCKVNSDSTAELYLHEKHKKMAEPTTRQEREKIINRIVPELNQISSKTASDGIKYLTEHISLPRYRNGPYQLT